MNQREILIAAILLNPDDDLARYAYADCLEEGGNPVEAKFARDAGPFAMIKAIDMWTPDAPIHEYGPRLSDQSFRLYYAHSEMLPPLPTLSEVTFRLGFIDAIRTTTEAFLANAATLFASQPIRRVGLSDRDATTNHEFAGFYRSARDRDVRDGDDLPPRLFDIFLSFGECDHTEEEGRRWVWPKDNDHAKDLLSRACVLFGRRAAKLTF